MKKLLSFNHRFLTGLSLLVLLWLVAAPCFAVDVSFTFQWDANHPSDDVVSYRIYWSDTSGTYNATDREEIAVTSLADPTHPQWTITIPLANEDDRVYFVATAVDVDTFESDYSNEVVTSAVSMDNIENDFFINSGNYAAFTLSGQSAPSSVVSIFVNGDATPWSTIADATDGSWSYDADFSSIAVAQGPVTIEARIIATGDSSGVISGTLDSVAPTFNSGPASVGETNNSATIEWTTDEDTQTLLEYSAISGNPVPIEITDATFIPSNLTHSMAIPGPGGDPLTPSTTYYYRVIATDAVGNQVTSSELQFVTTAESDTTAPIVTPHEATNIGYDTATISWTVNEFSNSDLQYTTISGDWTNPSSVSDSGTDLRSVTLSGLIPNKTYYFRISASDTSNNGPTITGEKNFTTLDVPDTTFPVIEEPPTAKSINDTSATITWVTDEPSDSVVEYGLTTSYGSTKTVTAFVTDPHSVPLTGLNPKTTYHYRVSSTDDDGNGPTTSGDKTFVTLETPDTKDPVISGITVIDVTDTSATITWDTDEPSSSLVQYGTASNYWDSYPSSKNGITMTDDHTVTLTGLTRGTFYYYRVGSTDGAANGPAVSGESKFLTETAPDISAPQFDSPPTVTGKTSTTATIEWTTDEVATSLVQYGLASSDWDSYPLEQNSVVLNTGHSVTLSDLTSNTEYYVMVGSEDALSNGPTTSLEITFTTDDAEQVLDERPRVTVPPTVTGITDTTAAIEWETDEPSNSEVRYAITESAWAGYTEVVVDSDMVTTHRIVLTNLHAATRYYFRVGSTDAADNGPNTDPEETNNPFSEDIFTTEVLQDTTLPRIITAPTVAAVDAVAATITWETDEPSNSLVQYGFANTDLALTLTAGDGEMVTQHSITLSNLGDIDAEPLGDFPDGDGDYDANGNGVLDETIAYYFRVASVDLAGNDPFESANSTNPSARSRFITLKDIDDEAPVISHVTMTFATDRTALITWTTNEPANSMVQHGLATNLWGSYGYSESDADMKTEHSVTITALQPDKHYFFRIASTDARGNGPDYNFNATNPSEEGDFTTDKFPDTVAPQIAGDLTVVVNVADKTAVVTWSTPDEPGNSQVRYDTSSQVWSGYAFSENDAEMVRSHSVTLTDLKTDTLYYVRVSSTDASGNNYNALSNDLNPSIERNFLLEIPDTDSGSSSGNTEDDTAECFIRTAGN